MSFFGKLKFWDKEPAYSPFDQAPQHFEGLDSHNTQNPDFNLPSMPNTPGFDSAMFDKSPNIPSAFAQLDKPVLQGNNIQKDIELIGAKLDALRAQMESMNQRLISIESIAKHEQEKNYRPRW
ncbi:MAG: hypothetical protein V1837_05470 [Candidatus Woesearchaeota archaeon]